MPASNVTSNASRTRNVDETLRQWQRYYRKAFPTFVFYFESIPGDVRQKCVRQIMGLGAREERFFSKSVTHVVTTRPVPPPIANGSAHQDATTNRQAGNDVLHRARQMNMKIWPLDKLQRVVSTINDEDPSAAVKASATAGHGNHLRGASIGASVSRARTSQFDQDSDLSRALRHDRVHMGGPSGDIVPFKGPFIYVHCACESTKPVMVREYPKASKRHEGIWPQFRSASLGKCPFVEEPAKTKPSGNASVKPKPVPQQQNPPQQEKKEIPVDKPASLFTTQPKPAGHSVMPEMRPMRPPEPKRTASTAAHNDVITRHEDEENRKPVSPRQAPFAKKRCISHLNTVEPVASGIQQSNITSAIRSQNVSSTAAATGVKAATSKEINELKRKVLEKNVPVPPAISNSAAHANANTGVSAVKHGANSTAVLANGDSNNLNDTATAANANANGPGNTTDAAARGSGVLQQKSTNMKAKARNPSTAKVANPPANAGLQAAPETTVQTTRKPPMARHDPKPGYCENCRDKFDDFDDHIESRKHRKFASTQDNWRDLDMLLSFVQSEQYRTHTPTVWEDEDNS